MLYTILTIHYASYTWKLQKKKKKEEECGRVFRLLQPEFAYTIAIPDKCF